MRSFWKIKHIKQNSYKPVKKKTITIYSRNCIIVEAWIGKNLLIHNGNSFKTLQVERKHIGFKVGEFAFSRQYRKKISKSDQSKNKK